MLEHTRILCLVEGAMHSIGAGQSIHNSKDAQKVLFSMFYDFQPVGTDVANHGATPRQASAAALGPVAA